MNLLVTGLIILVILIVIVSIAVKSKSNEDFNYSEGDTSDPDTDLPYWVIDENKRLADAAEKMKVWKLTDAGKKWVAADKIRRQAIKVEQAAIRKRLQEELWDKLLLTGTAAEKAWVRTEKWKVVRQERAAAEKAREEAEEAKKQKKQERKKAQRAAWRKRRQYWKDYIQNQRDNAEPYLSEPVDVRRSWRDDNYWEDDYDGERVTTSPYMELETPSILLGDMSRYNIGDMPRYPNGDVMEEVYTVVGFG
jgi:hypothetical protein